MSRLAAKPAPRRGPHEDGAGRHACSGGDPGDRRDAGHAGRIAHACPAGAVRVQPDAAREAVCNGTVDFAVNTLDEALRILKNEIRKQQAVSVLLQSDVSPALAEAADRGAQPDLIAWSPTGDPRIAPFLVRLVPRAWVQWGVQRYYGLKTRL